MRYDLAQYEDGVVYIKGPCPNSKCKCTENSLIIMNEKLISPAVTQLTIRCIVCQTPIKTNIRAR